MNKSDSRPPLSWRDAAIAFSLANLSFLNLWSQLLTYTRPDRYTMKYAPAPALYGGLILDVVLYGAVLWAGIAACRRLKGHAATLARLGFLLLLVLPLNALRAAMSQHVPFLKSDLILKIGVKGVIILAAVLGLTAALAALRFPRQLARAAASVLLLFSPFVAVTFLQGAWKMARYDPRPFADGPPASPPLQVAKTSPRFLWVIFDEWDQRLTFPERLPRLKLPAIDRIRRESLYASNAIPAGPETTISMPAMTTGRLVETFRHGDANELFLRMADNKQVVSWGKLPNVFADARAAGFRTAADPSTTRDTPRSSQKRTRSISRMPPPSSTDDRTEPAMRSTAAAFTSGRPKAPSRSTTWIQSAPADSNSAATDSGRSE